jgi:photosystem II stability/assembly factor-like uncharacterized protein
MRKYFCTILLGAVMSFFAAVPNTLFAGQYFQDFSGSAIGDTTFSDGSQLFTTSPSVAQVVFSPYNELQLTASGDSSVNSAFELPDLDSDTPVYAFSAKWNMPVYGNFPNAADGFSFNFGQLSSLNLGTNTIAQESGYGVGLSFDIQTYSGSSPGFYIRANGNIVASSPYIPQIEWGVNNGARHFFEVDWNYYAGMTVRMDGQTIFANVVITNFTPQAGDRFVFAARCGSLSEYIRLDNIAVVTGGNLVQLPPASPYYANNDLGSARTNAFDGDNSTYWNAIGSLPAYVGATFLPTNSVALYTLTSANSASRNGDPQTFTLDGSSNGGGSWTTVGSGSNCYFQNAEETHCFPVTSSAAFGAYRLNVTATDQSGSGCSVGELRLYALSAVGPEKWAKVNAPSSAYEYVACSADGTTVYAGTPDQGGSLNTIFRSHDSGQTWTDLGTFGNWQGVSCSYDGQVVAAASGFNNSDFIYSTNGGTNWNAGPSDNTVPEWVAVSGNGKFILCEARGNNPYFSTNSGATWQQVPLPVNSFGLSSAGAVAASYSGNQLLVARLSSIWHSTDGGQTWSALTAAPNNGWGALAVSADGQIILGGTSDYTARYYISTNGGVSFSTNSFPVAEYFNSAAMSADGQRMLLVAPYSGLVYESFDTGAHWSLANVPSEQWIGAACSTNGSTKYISGGDIWKAAPPAWPPGNSPVPLTLNFNNQYPVLSWPAFTPGFSLQSNTNLASTNWVGVPYPAQFNRGATCQVTDLPSGGAKFYRLQSP